MSSDPQNLMSPDPAVRMAPATRSRSVAGAAARSAGARQAPSVDALHAHGRLRATARRARHRARRGLLRVRHATASATSTGSPRCTASTSATGAPSWGRPPPSRPSSSASIRTGATPTHRSIELAARLADLASGELNRVFFVSGGSEAVESAWKLAKAYHAARGEPRKHKIVSRNLAYHGTSMGALTVTGLPPLREPFEPLTPGGIHVPNTNSYRWTEARDPLWAADAIEEAIVFEGPDTVAAVILEPVQNGGGCFVAQEGYFQRVREICDRHGVLLISDEVICGFGRLGHWFGCERFAAARHHDRRQGHDLRVCPDGRCDRLRPHRRAFLASAAPSSTTASPSVATRWPVRWRWPTST